MSEPSDDTLEVQLERYARDLVASFRRERKSARRLDAAMRQLGSYAKDLRGALEAARDERADLERAFLGAMRRLGSSPAHRGSEVCEHGDRVAGYARMLSSELDLDAARLQVVATAASLHDVGKIAIPEAVLLLSGSMEPEDVACLRTHVEAGAALFCGPRSDLLEVLHSVILAHHEHWDGSGYPFGLAGDAIPLEARIVALADVYDTLRSSRPYKSACSHAEALDAIFDGNGRVSPSHFDPRLLEALRASERRFAESGTGT